MFVRNLDESIVNALKERAVKHRCLTEAEHQTILAEVLMKPQRISFTEALASIPAVGMDQDFQHEFAITRVDLFTIQAF